ncbi:MAG: PKD domain-containing protein, partial [Candidatus Dadabacteria bacterium]|nr:PKD domain-containing protein [Candidatus Dadabacteria bacterium]
LTFDLTVVFSDQSTDVVSWAWDFGDGNTSTSQNPVYTYAADGTYNVCLVTTNPCSTDSICMLVTVFDNTVPCTPTVASFTSASVGLDAVFNDGSSDATSWSWDFGDGGTDAVMNPTHTFMNIGTYQVTLTIISQDGCEGQYVKDIRIDAPDIDLLIPNAFTPNPNGSSGGYYDPTSFDNDVFYPITSWVTEYLLQMYNRWGELIFESTNHAIGWDGYYRGKLCQQGTYIWQIKLKWTTGEEFFHRRYKKGKRVDKRGRQDAQVFLCPGRECNDKARSGAVRRRKLSRGIGSSTGLRLKGSTEGLKAPEDAWVRLGVYAPLLRVSTRAWTRFFF